MIIIKTKQEIELMREAGRIVAGAHKEVSSYIKPGISTAELDKVVEEYIISQGATPSFKGYQGFPGSICASINNQVVHGIPSDKVTLNSGDIISIDIGANYNGYHGDSAWTYVVGETTPEIMELLKITEQSLFAGLDIIKPGIKFGDISHAIESFIKENSKYGIVEELTGHGIGSSLHEEPFIPNFGQPNTGQTIEEGMTFAIEPMINLGSKRVGILPDNWTIVTLDGKVSAHFEHTIVVTSEGYEILTKLD